MNNPYPALAEAHRWRELLDLLSQLAQEGSILPQRRLIVAAEQSWFAAQADLRISPAHFRLPGRETDPEALIETGPELIRRAYGQRTLQTAPAVPAPQDGYAQGSGINTLAAPLLSRGDPFGAITVQRDPQRPFSPSEIQFFELSTQYLANCLSLTRQVAIKNWRLEQLSLLRQVSQRLVHVTDLDELGRQVTGLIRTSLHYYYVALFTLEPGQEQMRYRASAFDSPRSDGAPIPAEPHPVPIIHLGEGIVGSVAATGAEILAPWVVAEPRYRYFESLPETQSEYALPLKVGDEVLGVLDLQSDLPYAFHEIDQLVLRSLADSIAIGIESTRQYDSAHRRADQLATLGDVSRAISSILDIEGILEEVVRILHNRFGYPFVHAFIIHYGRRKIVYQAGSGPRSAAFKARGLEYDLDAPLGMIPWTAREGKLLCANDVEQEPRYRPSELPPQNTRAELSVPLKYGDEVLGVLDVQSDRPNDFAEDDLFIFRTLAETVAVAVHNAQLYRSEQWRRQVAESLREIADLLSSNASLGQILVAILREARKNLPCSLAAFWLSGDDLPAVTPDASPGLRLAVVDGADPAEIQALREGPILPGQWLVSALASESPIIHQPGDPPVFPETALYFPVDHSAIATSFRIGGQTAGLILLAHPTAGRYGPEASRIVHAFASYAVVAIENTRLFASAQEQGWISTVLLQVSEATQSLATLEDLLDTVVRLTPMLVGINAGAIFLWDELCACFRLASSYGISPEQERSFAAAPRDPAQASAFARVLATRKPVFINNCFSELQLPETVPCEPDLTEYVLVPLATRSQFFGAFLVEHLTQGGDHPDGGTLGRDRLAILQGIAQQTAVAIENLRLLEAKQQEAYVTAVLLQVAQAVVSLNELDDILSAIVHILPILAGIETCAIYLLNQDATSCQVAQMYGTTGKMASQISGRRIFRGQFPLIDAVLESEGLTVAGLGSPPPPPNRWFELGDVGVREEAAARLRTQGDLLLGLPLSVKGVMYGVLLAQESHAPLETRERRVEILTGVAQQAALAIQNDRLNQETLERERLEHEFQLARSIQQTFLPAQLPNLKSWELGLYWQPAREVGGDFYDVFTLPGKRLGLVVADVSDKGMPAALYMTVTRTLIRAAAQEEASPARVLMRVNNLLLMDAQTGLFVTAFYLVVDLQTGSAIYADAGHNLPLHVHAHGQQIEPLHKGGMALAVLADTPLEDDSLELDEGDLLLLYTDGVTETFSPTGEEFGEERLAQILAETRGSPAKAVVVRIEDAIRAFADGAPAADDVTLLALRRRSAS